MIKKLIQGAAFFFPSPINAWLHRLYGARIGRGVSLHIGVLIRAAEVVIGDEATIKMGVMLSVRRFHLGRKSSIGFHTLAKGESDLIVGDACIIGPRCMLNCSREIVMDYYSGVGPGSYLYTHGSGMPVTEGFRSTFGPIRLGTKVWVSMRCVIGPGVTIGDNSCLMPGTILVESVGEKRVVSGFPAEMKSVPLFLVPIPEPKLNEFGRKILEEYSQWTASYAEHTYKFEDGVLTMDGKGTVITVAVDQEADIVLYTQKGKSRNGPYFNISDLTTDKSSHPRKRDLEAYMRLYYGLIFLEP